MKNPAFIIMVCNISIFWILDSTTPNLHTMIRNHYSASLLICTFIGIKSTAYMLEHFPVLSMSSRRGKD